MSNNEAFLIVDIGGTNFRVAWLKENLLTNIQSFSCRDYSGPLPILKDYIEKLGLKNISVCMAVASPSTGDLITMTNVSWEFSQREIKDSLGLNRIFVINDFHAMSMSVINFDDQDKVKIGDGEPQADKAMVICGPGTGMGLGHLIPHKNEWLAVPGEGGHADLVINSELEAQIWQTLHKKHPHVFVELILSGPGLETLYQCLCQIKGITPQTYSAADISSKAVANECDTCVLTLNTFCEMLGSYCGSLALNAGAMGGVYITGGMIPRFINFFKTSKFRERFEAKGTYQFYMNPIPTYVVTNKIPGLIGAAEYLRSQLIDENVSISKEAFRGE